MYFITMNSKHWYEKGIWVADSFVPTQRQSQVFRMIEIKIDTKQTPPKFNTGLATSP